jgi:hypothetical protein
MSDNLQASIRGISGSDDRRASIQRRFLTPFTILSKAGHCMLIVLHVLH